MKYIIVIEKGAQLEAWGGVTNACRAHPEFRYHSIKMKEFPFTHKGYTFNKIPYNVKNAW